MLALWLSLASGGELAPYARVDVDEDGLSVIGAATSPLTRHSYLYTGITWQDGLDPVHARGGVGRPHADVGVVGEIGALHLLGLVGAGWDGWDGSPLVVGRLHAVVELPPLPLLIENRTQVEASLGARLDTENRTVALFRVQPFAVGVQVEPGWTRDADPRLPLGLRANAALGPATLGLFAGWDVRRGQPAARLTAVMPL